MIIIGPFLLICLLLLFKPFRDFLWVILLLLAFVYIVGSASASAAVPQIPLQEAQFIQITNHGREESLHAINDMQRGAFKVTRDKDLCHWLGSHQVRKWVGVVDSVDGTSSGKGILKIRIAEHIVVETENNVLSDSLMPVSTLINPGTVLFSTASSLSPGQRIEFSGEFFTDDDGSCINEASITLQGGLEDPEFIFRFEHVSLLKTP